MYVEIMGISEAVFWDKDIAFVQKAASNISAYQKWIKKKQREEAKRHGGK